MSTRKDRYGDILVTNEGAQLFLLKRRSSFLIQSFEAHIPNKGYGRKLMNRIIRFANKRNVRLTLQVGKYRPWGLNNDQLRVFYASFGFRFKDPKDDRFMEYIPCGT